MERLGGGSREGEETLLTGRRGNATVSVHPSTFQQEKCEQFSWIGFPSKPEPRETVKIELGRVSEGGGRTGGGLHLPHSGQPG